MRRILRTGTTLLLAGYAAACSPSVDQAAVVPPAAAHDNQAPLTPGTCTTLNSLITLANSVFAPTITEAGLVVHNLNTMQQQLNAGDLAGAQATAFTLTQMIVTESKQGRLIGSAADATSLTNGTLCYAALPITTTDPTNTWVVLPSDNPQVIVASSAMAATSLPGHVVTEPTVITFAQVTTPGASPLNTKLDQYPNYFAFTASSANNAPLTQPVTVAVCPSPDVPSDVLPRLRLGHQTDAGFEVTPAADASFLVCPSSNGLRVGPAWLRKLASLVLPAPLLAKTRTSGGVGGTAGTFRTFGPVDDQVSLSGGVGGTAGVFLRGAPSLRDGCSIIEAPIGTPIPAECRPAIKVQTHLGTVLNDVPIAFIAGQDGGIIAPEANGTCGTATSLSFALPTNSDGKAAACWTMGPTAGTNTVVAIPGTGGDVPADVSFSPATITFTANANPPTGLVFTQQPAAGSAVTAGTTFPAMASVVDHNGVTVLGFNGAVSLGLNQNGWSTGASTMSTTATRGVATFSGLVVNPAATGYQLIARATLDGSSISQPGTLFNVVAGPGTGMLPAQGDNQSTASGSAVPVVPKVKVTDALGNPVSGALIVWSTGGIGAAQPVQSATGADGAATTAWTVGDGANTLTATLSRLGQADLTVVFHATGTASVVTMNICPARGMGAPTSAIVKPLAALAPIAGAAATPPVALGAPATHLVPLTHCVTLQ